MFFLIMTVCATAAMDDCQVYAVNQHQSAQQCEAVADVYRQVLGGELENNYRISCEAGEVGDE